MWKTVQKDYRGARAEGRAGGRIHTLLSGLGVDPHTSFLHLAPPGPAITGEKLPDTVTGVWPGLQVALPGLWALKCSSKEKLLQPAPQWSSAYSIILETPSLNRSPASQLSPWPEEAFLGPKNYNFRSQVSEAGASEVV